MKATGFLIFFVLFWSALTLLFDGFTFLPAARQLLALQYAQTQGTILSSEVTTSDDSEGGTTHGVKITYAYSVENQGHTGTRYRYGSFSSTDSAWARQAVAERPPGKTVTVYYNALRPADALLVVGVHGSDLFMMAFMTPFNAVMLGLWYGAWIKLRRKWHNPVAGGVKIIQELRSTRVRLTPIPPLAAGFLAITLVAFFSIFVVGFFAGGFHPSLRAMTITWAVIFSGGITAAVWQAAKIAAGKYDLIIDELGSQLELPATEGRKERVRIPLASVERLLVEVVRQRSSDESETTPGYAPAIQLAGNPSRIERLVKWYDREKADSFLEWLASKLPTGGSARKELR
jgi:hypothetical protein